MNSMCPYIEYVHAGFNVLTEASRRNDLNLHDYAVEHPEATFFMRVSGESMIDKGIFPDDIVVVDKSREPRSGSLIVAVHNGSFTIKSFEIFPDGPYLCAYGSEYTKEKFIESDDTYVWGVVAHALHSFI